MTDPTYHAGVQIFAACAPGLEPVLLAEVQALGAKAAGARAVAGGVELEGDERDLMRLNLWLRTASRVLVRLGEIKATAFAELVRKATALPWEKYAGAAAQLRVTCRKSRLYHSGAVAERLHEALEARVKRRIALRKADEEREGPQLFVARFDRDRCLISADSSGALLHQRGWRGPQAKAPLRETLAAALLLAAGWKGEALCDPLCGSGTIAIEAAHIAMRRAPGLARAFAFQDWPGFDVRPFAEMVAQARAEERPLSVRIEASDHDASAVAATRENALRAGAAIDIAQRRLADLPAARGAGLIACNPPYGVRLEADVRGVFRELGDAARRRRWALAAIAAEERAAAAAGLPFRRLLRTQNGGIPVQLLFSAAPAA